jgi:hypothetical protein
LRDDSGVRQHRRLRLCKLHQRGPHRRQVPRLRPRQIKITDSWLVDVNVSGIVGNFLVNDVDVTALVETQLDERHPERVQLRQMQTGADYGAIWDVIERLWSQTVARSGQRALRWSLLRIEYPAKVSGLGLGRGGGALKKSNDL